MNAPHAPEHNGAFSGHQEFEVIAAGWVLHALEPDEEARFAIHLPACPICPDAVAELEATLAELAYAAPAYEPPAGLGDRILTAATQAGPGVAAPRRASEPGEAPTAPLNGTGPGVARDGGPAPVRPTRPPAADPTVPFDRIPPSGPVGPSGPTPAVDPTPALDRGRRPRPGPVPGESGLRPVGAHRGSRSRPGGAAAPPGRAAPSRRRGPARWVAAVAAVVALALGGWNVLLQQDVRESRDTAREAQQLVDQRESLVRELVQPGTRSAKVLDLKTKRTLGYVVVRGGQVQVVPDGLSRNDRANTSYWVWAFRGETPVPIGLFDVTGAGLERTGLGALPAAVRSTTQFAISVEPGRDRPTKPTTVLGLGPVGG